MTTPVRPTDALDGHGWRKDLEHFSRPVTPFGWSVLKPAMDRTNIEIAAGDGLLIDGIEQRMIGGEVYIRPVPPIGDPGAAGGPPPALVLGLATRLHPLLRRRMRTARSVARTGDHLRRIERWESTLRDEYVRRNDELLAEDLTALDDDALGDHFDRAAHLFDDGFTTHIELMAPFMLGVHQAVRTLAEHLGFEPARTLALLGGHSPASVRPVAELRDLVLGVTDVDELVASLEAQPRDPVVALRRVDDDLAVAMKAWIDRHGWRGLSNDPGWLSIVESPETITRTLLGAATGLTTDAANDPAASEQEFDVDGLDPRARDEVESSLANARRVYGLREDNVALTFEVPGGLLRRALCEAGPRLAARGVVDDAVDAAYATFTEVRRALAGDRSSLVDTVARRRGEEAWTTANPGPLHVGEESPLPDLRYVQADGRAVNEAMIWAIDGMYPEEDDAADPSTLLTGVPASPGRATGTVVVVRGEDDFGRLSPGDVLVCVTSTPAWTILFGIAAAVVTDGGGVLAHAAIVAREHGIPAVLGTNSATTTLEDGMRVEVDGTAGTVVAR